MTAVHELLEPVLSERFQNRVRLWLRIFSGASVAAAVFAPLLGERPFVFAVLLPFLHCPLLWAVLFIRSFPDPWMSQSSLYIKNTHPDVWRRLHPWGDSSHDSFASFAFFAGRYDDGGDQHLELIKQRSRRLSGLYLWPFALIPVCWAIAIPMRFAFGRGGG